MTITLADAFEATGLLHTQDAQYVAMNSSLATAAQTPCDLLLFGSPQFSAEALRLVFSLEELY